MTTGVLPGIPVASTSIVTPGDSRTVMVPITVDHDHIRELWKFHGDQMEI